MTITHIPGYSLARQFELDIDGVWRGRSLELNLKLMMKTGGVKKWKVKNF